MKKKLLTNDNMNFKLQPFFFQKMKEVGSPSF